MKRGFLIFLILEICIQIAQITFAYGTPVGFPENIDQITYFASDPIQPGLWSFNLITGEKKLIIKGISDNYKFSPDGRYLAFLVNNCDWGIGQSNTISLWVRDLAEGIEYVIQSIFDTENNLDTTFEWFANDKLAVIQRTDLKNSRIQIYKPNGKLIWISPENYQFLSFANQKVLLKDNLNENLVIYCLLTNTYKILPVKELLVNASLSIKTNYLCYQTFRKIILLNLNTLEKVYIDVGKQSEVQFDWSPDENYLIYQTLPGSGELYQLKVFNVQTGIKEFEVNSEKQIYYSWSSDEKQVVISLYQNGWNLLVWFPDQYNLMVIQSGLVTQPIPVYRQGTHQFYYLTHVDYYPVVYSYDVDYNRLDVTLSGPEDAVWSRLNLIPVTFFKENEAYDLMYWAGWSEVAEIQYLRSLEIFSNEDYYTVLKWAPFHPTLVYKENDRNLIIIDETGKMKRIYTGTKISEPFWNDDGSYICFTDQEERKRLILYNIFKNQIDIYPLESDNLELIQWMNGQIWFYDGRIRGYYPLGDDWDNLQRWKDYWWPLPKIKKAHYLAKTLWQIGANLWFRTEDGEFKVITRLTEGPPQNWQVQWNGFAQWSPDDEKILYNRLLTRTTFYGQEKKREIWVMDKNGTNHRYLCEGAYSQWLDNYRFLFLKEGNLYLANLVTGQINGLDTPELEEIAFVPSCNGASLVVVIARDEEGKLGLYLYKIKYR
ncbi:hypothetical protein BBF96_02795 [Anoxybacter fermentans]|uniref:Dipeptidylpeptidase IV N-terminal domain-containing protein n=1 Tax=Anoxybacter fermentans TaxID=1323375 RepID=A0A3Q9HP35_9FIRM|nr:hypothetical protein [Anoxybacter fermentans]AZR72414.1 hypothetical protein BBF96_02795 [Anoxybacter fermentans]